MRSFWLTNRALLFVLSLGSVIFLLPLVYARPQHSFPSANNTDPTSLIPLELDSSNQELEARQIVPKFKGIGNVYRKYATTSAAAVNSEPTPEPKSDEPGSYSWMPRRMGGDGEKEEDFNGRECLVGLYKNAWFRNTEPGYKWTPYERWEGYPLGRWGDQLQKDENCWEVADDLNPKLKNEIRYAIMTGHCDCHFFGKPGCDKDSWLFSGHDVDGEVPSKGWTKIQSFRCHTNDHYESEKFENCHVSLTNGGDAHEPNGKFNLYFNLLDGYSQLQFWYQDLFFDKNTIKEDKGTGGSLCWAIDPVDKIREDKMDQYIRYANASGCSCTIYSERDCTGEALREVGGYGTDVQYNWPSTAFIRPGSVRCWPPYGLSHGKRADKGPERKKWGFET
ncbi:hypothetical protein TWF718_008292 [Orbilia javanica]|uniref:Uncharacterized protein n=1 Tax=Orbilia javanica TaxID=47235 RepID=A0AAN8RCC0_9PEZI